MSGNISAIYGKAFDKEVENDDDFGVITPGWYSVEVDKAEIRETKAKNGCYLSLQFSIIGDSFNNRKIFTNINLVNPNEKAVKMGEIMLAKLRDACLLEKLEDTDELLGKQLQVKVVVRKDHKDENDIKDFKPLGADTEPVKKSTVATATTQTETTSTSSSKRPWEK